MSVVKKFTKEDKYEEELLKIPTNKYLRDFKDKPKDKYDIFKDHDPFPSIPDALLNSYDVVRYVYTTGMIYPFSFENLEGAVYQCNFSGYCKYWDEKHKPQERSLGKAEEMTLPPNSISFLEIEQTFQIPTYIVLRFNLKVKHVYKGLLLGTGPIVDPGFVGNLYIPLHNLTSNAYVIKKDALLISVEFTKLSNHNYRKLTESQEQIIKGLKFNVVPIISNPMETETKHDLNFYLNKALLTDSTFRKNRNDELSVGSSIPDAIMDANENSREAKENAWNAEYNVNKIKSFYTKIGLVATITIIIAIVTLVINIFSLIDGINARIDNILSQYNGIKNENIQIQEEYKKLKDDNISLQNIINSIKQTEKDKEAVSESSENRDQRNTQ